MAGPTTPGPSGTPSGDPGTPDAPATPRGPPTPRGPSNDGSRRRRATGRPWRACAADRARALSPGQVALVAAGAALAFVLLRLLVAADGDITAFVVAGEAFVDAEAVRAAGTTLEVRSVGGYDGQFFWRLAVDPTEWRLGEHYGVTLDTPYRLPRIGYPLLAHLAAGGQIHLVAWSLVAVNVAAVGGAGHAGGLLARAGGHAPVWGLGIPAASGLVLALGRDLAEVVTVACLAGGLAALAHRRPWIAAGLWSYAVLTREQALITVGAYGIWRLALWAHPAAASLAVGRRAGTHRTAAAPRDRQAAHGSATAIPPARGSPTGAGDGAGDGAEGAVWTRPTPAGLGAADLAWMLPALVFVAWQIVLWRGTGAVPAAEAGGTNIVPPFTDMVPGLLDWAQGGLGRFHLPAPVQLAATVAVVTAAVRVATGVSPDQRFAVLALGLAILAATCLASSIWRDPSDLRHLVDVWVLAWVVLLGARRPPPAWAAALAGGVWLVTAAARVVAL